MSPESAYALLEAIAEIHGCTDKLKLWEMDTAEAKEQEEAQEISEERKERLSPFTFTKCNIQPGETIYFYTDPELTCKVVDDKYVNIRARFTLCLRWQQHYLDLSGELPAPDISNTKVNG